MVTHGTEPFRSRANSHRGANWPIGPGRIRSLVLSLPGPFFPWPFRSLELSRRLYIFSVASFQAISLRGAKFPGSELARVLLADSLLGANWPGGEKAVIFCDKSAAGSRRFCDLPTTENDVLSEKET